MCPEEEKECKDGGEGKEDKKQTGLPDWDDPTRSRCRL